MTNATNSQHREQITDTLRSLIEVRPSVPGSLVERPDFWNRCELVTPGKLGDGEHKKRIFVDGFAGACHWNSLQTYINAAEAELELWCGYALYSGVWVDHAWCMLGERIVETTAPFQLYYGSALSAEEREHLAQQFGELAADSPKRKCVVTIRDGERQRVWKDLDAVSKTIGRERDWRTGEVLPGLGW